MLVEIIRGVYGYRPNPNENRVIRKDDKSPAFELDNAEAERLIALGVAKVCTSETAQETKGAAFLQMTEEEMLALDFNDIRKLAKRYGLNSKGTKEELISRLKDVMLSEEKENVTEDGNDDEDVFVDDDELPPELTAQEPV